ncbi:MAG: sulfatase-like hydrolase/transferase [Bacteriovoracaceae bacterium]|nr:sulfatase-like hydrolase/transferase [Bacteriovoracaceae bacterium]
MRYGPEKAQPYLFHQINQLIKTAMLMALVLMLGRLFFIFKFTELVVLKKNLPLTLKAMFLGFRYDLIPVAYVLTVPYILTLIGFAFPRDGYLKFLPWFHRVWNFFFIFILVSLMVCDLGFYSFFQDHINILFFGLWEDDTSAVLTSIYKNYNVFLWIPMILAGLGLNWWLLGKWFKKERIDLFYSQPFAREELGLIFSASLVLIAFLGRGNFTRLPLSIEDAHISDIESINELSVNGAIALNRAYKIRKEFGKEEVRYLTQQGYTQLSTAVSDLLTYRNATPPVNGWTGLDDLKKKTNLNPAAVANPPHVILVVMESFGSMWWPFEKEMPFLDSLRPHTEQDYLFLNFLSSENGTIGSIVSVATGLPLRPGARFLSEGEYMRTQLASGAHWPYKQAGYNTRYLYGGKLGWRQLGSYLQSQGWDQLEGAEQLTDKMNLLSIKESDRGNEWGIFDEYLFKYIEQEIKVATKPQFFLVLTTSNHPPYETPSTFKQNGLSKIPESMKNLFTKTPDEVLQRFKTMQYSNRQLGDFITKIKSGDLKDKTVIAATGDHSFWIGKDEGKPGLIKKYAVPFYIYLPDALKPASWNPKNWGSHIDMLPTLYERTLSEVTYWSFGQDMFAARNAAINSFGIAADESGAWINGESFCFENPESNMLMKCEADNRKLMLGNYLRSEIGLTDEFLRANAAGQIRPLP